MITNFKQIIINGKKTGLIGLEEIFEAIGAENTSDEANEEFLKQKLVELAGKKNYIPESAFENYKKALYREYKIFSGQTTSDGENLSSEDQTYPELRVLGPACSNCHKMFEFVQEICFTENIPADLMHLTDLSEIAQFGLVATPALVINGKIVISGKVPNKERIKVIILKELGLL